MKKALAVSLVGALALLGACGDDDDGAAPGPGAQETETETDGEATSETVTVTITADGIDVPAEIPGGVVQVEVDNQAGGEEIDVGFARVTSGTSEDAFRTALQAAFSGEAIDEAIEATSGVAGGAGTTSESILLEPGEHFVFAEVPADPEATDGEDDGESTLLVATTTVTEGSEGELPEGSGTITASDYAFEVDVEAGDAFTFRNEGPGEFHHAVLLDFGDIDPAVVEENIVPFLESEGGEGAPEPLADLQGDPFVGGSSVFSPGLGGTFHASLESGNTYAAVCFIGDRAGGPPHAFAHNMFEVFTVE